MLREHFAAVEKVLLAQSSVAANSGHSLHMGTPREWFVRDFLNDHLGLNIGIGSGEIIDSTSEAKGTRNQFDVVIYRTDFPKLCFGGGIDCFLAESVIATIEVKSTLKEEEFKTSVAAAAKLKAMKRSLYNAGGGYYPPAIASFIVAFDGVAKMQTVLGWLNDAHAACKPPIQAQKLPADQLARLKIPSPSIDGVFVLGVGFLKFDNLLLTFTSDDGRKAHPDHQWEYGNAKEGALQELFLILTFLATSYTQTLWEPRPYLKGFPTRVVFAAP
ncbi:MAG: hypothetical protein K8U57_03835 [Planctomycetes bacterium]|jgi:hypothetical protein|nr:hypothetical protein [Planctomycetota bacterium]